MLASLYLAMCADCI